MMTSILWKICTLLPLVLINTGVECLSCYMDHLDKIDGKCTAQINCERDLDYDVRTWECIKHYDYASSGSSYPNYKSTRTNYYGLGYRQYGDGPSIITYDDNYNLIIYIKEPRESCSFFQYRLHTIKLIIEDGDYLTMPQEVFQMKTLKEFTISGNNIANVNLNKFNSVATLEKLSITNNMIRVIETDENSVVINNGSKVGSIQVIDISYNHVEVLPNSFVSSFSQLQQLNLSHNMISSIDSPSFESIKQLQTLDISHNRLTEIGHALGELNNLKELYISYNRITKLVTSNFEALTNLEKLDVSSNGIHSVDNNAFQALINLREVDFRLNNLTRICNDFFFNNVNLTSLFLSSNKIQTIEGNSFKKAHITMFNIQDNKLGGVLEKNTFAGVNVLELDLSGANLTVIADMAFVNMSLLKTLNMSSNSLSNISYSAFSSLVMLNVLDLSHNSLIEFNFNSQSLQNMTELYVQHNKISKIIKSVFENFLSLEKLDLSFNDLSKIEPGSFLQLQYVSLFDIKNTNFVYSLATNSLQGMTSLAEINMYQTKTTVFQNESFSGLIAFIELNYTFGQLTDIGYNAFLGAGSLDKLILSNNQLLRFHVNTSTISEIQEIYLDNNYITTISNETFLNLTRLNILNLANNDITVLHPDAFQNLNALTDLNLSSNKKIKITENLFHNLNELYILSLANVTLNISFENSNLTAAVLNLKCCGIVNVHDLKLFSVQYLFYLYLSTNDISNINKKSFENATRLSSLDLSLNKISYIQPGSFLTTRNLRSVNLYGNELSYIPFGVFDGIELLRDLNLTNNVLHTLDFKILPAIEELYIDNNVLTDLKYEDVLAANLSKLSVGGNLISCKILVELKASANSDQFKLIVTANILNYHSENVNGVSCQTAGSVRNNTNNVEVGNNSNISALIPILKDVSAKLSQSLNTVRRDDVTSEDSNTKGQNIIKLLKHMIESKIETKATKIEYLDQLTKVNKEANVLLKKIYNQTIREKGTLEKEIKSSLTKTTLKLPQKNNSVDFKTVLNFIAVCLVVLLLVYVGNIIFQHIKAPKCHRKTHSCNSFTNLK